MLHKIQLILKNFHLTTILFSLLFMIYIHKDFQETNTIIYQSNVLSNMTIYSIDCENNGSIFTMYQENCSSRIDCSQKVCKSMNYPMGHVSIFPLNVTPQCIDFVIGTPTNIVITLVLGYMAVPLLFILFIVTYVLQYENIFNYPIKNRTIENARIFSYTVLKFIPIVSWAYITSFSIKNEELFLQNQGQELLDIKTSKSNTLLVFFVLESLFFGATNLVPERNT